MSPFLNHTLAACALALGACALCAAPSADAAAKKPAKTKPAEKKAAEKQAAEPNPELDEPDVLGSTTTEFNCELGNKVTIYQNDSDNDHIALRWKKRLHRLTRVTTTTGAQRFENPSYGLIWIGIPAKGMLLDSKLNHQLANECKSTEQMKSAAVAPIVTGA